MAIKKSDLYSSLWALHYELWGDIPERPLDVLDHYWKIIPKLRAALFEKFKFPGYCQLPLPIAEVLMDMDTELAALESGGRRPAPSSRP